MNPPGNGTATKKRPRVVILGGGFGGLEATKALKGAEVDVTVVDRRNHFTFQPLLYQVATAALSPSDIATPIRRIFRGRKNVEVILGEATAIDAPGKRLVLADGVIEYDYLVVATGATHAYLGHDEWAEFAPGLKSVDDATAIRRKVLLAYEAAEREVDPARRRAWLTFVVVGAGPTGVEMAGSLIEIARHVFSRDFRKIDTKEARVLLVEAGPRVLAAYPEPLSAKAQTQLEQLGVEVKTGTPVTGIDDEGVDLGEDRIDARTVIWGAGVAANPIGKSLGVALDKNGRVKVAPDLSVPGHPEIAVVGDLVSLEQDGKPLPGVAPAAMQGGKYAGKRILAMIEGKPVKPFRYFDKGVIATIGRASAVGVVGKLQLSGFIAWAAWLGIHIVYLVGFRNRLLVLTQWAWVYLTYDRGARLITGPPIHDLLRDAEAPPAAAPAPAAAG